MKIEFTKMHGCGNDYVYINGFTQRIEQEKKRDFVIRVSDRHFGIGSDGAIFINPSDKADSTSITIFKAKLAQRMPAMDIIIPGITVNKNGNVTVLAADSTVPLAMGNPFPNYTVTGFEGEILNDEITFSLKFGSTPTSYSGQLLK